MFGISSAFASYFSSVIIQNRVEPSVKNFFLLFSLFSFSFGFKVGMEILVNGTRSK